MVRDTPSIDRRQTTNPACLEGAVARPPAMSPTIKIREDRARRLLAKRGLRLCKTPSRVWVRCFGPRYMVLNHNMVVVMGSPERKYQATLEEIEAFARALLLAP